jgi:hypothetical protein
MVEELLNFGKPRFTLNNWHERSVEFFNWLEEHGYHVEWGDVDSCNGVESGFSDQFDNILEKFVRDTE